MALSAVISASASGDNTVVAAVPGYAIRVVGYVLTFSAAVNARWMSDVGGGAVALSGLLYGVGTGPPPVAAPEMAFAARGWFQTAPGKALNLNLSGAVAVGGHVLYELAGQ
jgi:hypothetical protein